MDDPLAEYVAQRQRDRRRRWRTLGLWLVAAVLLWILAVWIARVWGGEAAYRRADWPHWRTVEVDGLRCSVRVHVLRRDAQRRALSAQPDLDTAPDDPCLVLGGLWLDRYTGQPIGDPRGLDVDHLIPLAWAARHGGAAWSPQRKADYANNLRGYRWHLLAVSASANRQKGDQGPDTWVPSNAAFHCQYGEAWATTLVVWNLSVDEPTRQAIATLVEAC